MSKEIKLKFTYYDEGKDLYTFETDKGGKVICKCVKPAIIRTLGAVVKNDFKTNARFMCVINETTTPGLFWINECIKFDKKVQKTLDVSADEVDSMIDNSKNHSQGEVGKNVIGVDFVDKDKPLFTTENVLKAFTNSYKSQDEVFKILSKLRPKTEKKGQFDYISWSNCWSDIMKHYPNSSFRVIENSKGFPAFITKEYGGYVKVAVTIESVERMEIFPIMNNFNKTHMTPTITDINKSLKRAMVKACVYFGYGLHLYSGEELEE